MSTTTTSKNAFLAFGLPPEDATVDTLRSDLAAAIARFLAEGRIPQKKAVEILGLPQGTVSNITRGNIEHLSVERLVRAMVRARIPGWAEWPTPELARAGCGFFPVSVATAARTEQRPLGAQDLGKNPPMYLDAASLDWERWLQVWTERERAPGTFMFGFQSRRNA